MNDRFFLRLLGQIASLFLMRKAVAAPSHQEDKLTDRLFETQIALEANGEHLSAERKLNDLAGAFALFSGKDNPIIPSKHVRQTTPAANLFA